MGNFNNFSTKRPIFDRYGSSDLKLCLTKESPTFHKFELLYINDINELIYPHVVTSDLFWFRVSKRVKTCSQNYIYRKSPNKVPRIKKFVFDSSFSVKIAFHPKRVNHQGKEYCTKQCSASKSCHIILFVMNFTHQNRIMIMCGNRNNSKIKFISTFSCTESQIFVHDAYIKIYQWVFQRKWNGKNYKIQSNRTIFRHFLDWTLDVSPRQNSKQSNIPMIVALDSLTSWLLTVHVIFLEGKYVNLQLV